MRSVVTYFADLGFLTRSEDLRLGPGLDQQRILWTLAVYVLSALGMFFAHYIDLHRGTFKPNDAISASVLIASFVIALAIFPLTMRWFNTRVDRPNWEHILYAFSYGFFLNLATENLGAQVLAAITK